MGKKINLQFLESIRSLGKDMSIYGISSIVSQILSFFLLPLYTSYLTPADYGIISLVGIFASFYAIFSNMGISSALFRFTGMAKTPKEKEKYLDTAQFINYILNFGVLVLTLLFTGLIANIVFDSAKYSNFVIIGIFTGVVTSLSDLPLSYLRVERKPKTVAIASIINLVFSIVFTLIGLIILKLGVWGAIGGSLIGNISALFFLYSKVKFPVLSNFSKYTVTTLVKYALPMFPHKLFGFIFPIYAQVLLSKHLTIADLGIYNIAIKFCLPLSLFTKLFQKSYTPYKYEILKQGNNQQSTFRKFNLMYVSILLLGYTFITLFGKYLIEIFTNYRFHSAADYLWAIALIPVFQGSYYIFGTGVEFTKSPKFMPVISGAGLLTVLLLSPVFIKMYGIAGTGLSIATGWLIMAIFLYHYSQKLYPIKYSWYKILLLLGISISIQLLLSFENLNLYFRILLFVGFLVGLLVITPGLFLKLKGYLLLKAKMSKGL